MLTLNSSFSLLLSSFSSNSDTIKTSSIRFLLFSIILYSSFSLLALTVTLASNVCPINFSSLASSNFLLASSFISIIFLNLSSNSLLYSFS